MGCLYVTLCIPIHARSAVEKRRVEGSPWSNNGLYSLDSLNNVMSHTMSLCFCYCRYLTYLTNLTLAFGLTHHRSFWHTLLLVYKATYRLLTNWFQFHCILIFNEIRHERSKGYKINKTLKSTSFWSFSNSYLAGKHWPDILEYIALTTELHTILIGLPFI